MKSHDQSVQISFINEFELLWIFLCDFCKYRGVHCYTFISLFTSLSLCCLHLFRIVFMEKPATLVHFALVSRCFKITLSVSPLSNKNVELKRLFTMKNDIFSVCFFCDMHPTVSILLHLCIPCILCMGLSGTCTCRTVWKVVTEWMSFCSSYDVMYISWTLQFTSL